MTRKQLIANVVAVIIAFCVLIVVALAAKVFLKSTYCYDFIKDFSALFIAIGAAYLAYCFQQRQAFLFTLRELWAEIVNAKTRVNYYVNCGHPEEDAYHKAYRSLSKAIDLVRGVYINVGEDEQTIGLYPFEPLHDVRKCLETLRDPALNEEVEKKCREQVSDAWDALRFAFLQEFDRPAAAHPITRHFFKDPRRPPRKLD